MTSWIRHLQCILAITALLSFTPASARADVVLLWNEVMVRTVTTPALGINPFAQARFASIVQLAVFEAVNAIDGEYAPYLGSPLAPNGVPVAAPFGASADAAAIAAAHAVLVTYFGGNASVAQALNADLAASLGAIPASSAKDAGIATGLAAATAIMAQRVGDGSAPAAFYLPGTPANGQWAITPGCPVDTSGNPVGGVFAHWPNVKPFGIVQPATGHWADAFMQGPPPALTSNAYLKDYNEVKTVGASGPTGARPADKEVVVRFYGALSPTYLFNMVARQLAVARGDSLVENARNLALISMATNDSLVASFATKYHYNFWRPVTAIRAGDTDGSDKTDGIANFTTFFSTPCFPSYPSNHASGSGAAAEAVRRIYGAAGHQITLSGLIPVIGQVVLEYTSLERILDDIDDARVYGGIHFRFDQVAGGRLGRAVATEVYKNNLQPVHP